MTVRKRNGRIEVVIEDFGQYVGGLTGSEIKQYLKLRTGVKRLGNLFRQFNKLAGCNTMGVGECEFCKKEFSLMYREDVKRFTDKLLLGKETYFD